MVLVAIPEILGPVPLLVHGSPLIQLSLCIIQCSQTIKLGCDPAFPRRIIFLDNVLRRSLEALDKYIASARRVRSSDSLDNVIGDVIRRCIPSGLRRRSIKIECFCFRVPIGWALPEIVLGNRASEHVNWLYGGADLDVVSESPDVIINLMCAGGTSPVIVPGAGMEHLEEISNLQQQIVSSMKRTLTPARSAALRSNICDSIKSSGRPAKAQIIASMPSTARSIAATS